MTSNSAAAIMVAAPGTPAELIEELLGAGVLPRGTDLQVLLPSRNTQPYAQLKEGAFAGRVQFLPSP
ncbi:MAG: hypothetical protein WAU47_12260, partial [Desulfobaccales bacterium]